MDLLQGIVVRWELVAGTAFIEIHPNSPEFDSYKQISQISDTVSIYRGREALDALPYDRVGKRALTMLGNIRVFSCWLSQRYTNDVKTFQVVNSDLLSRGFRVNIASYN